jgi:outer membrane protein assembly factor BamB
MTALLIRIGRSISLMACVVAFLSGTQIANAQLGRREAEWMTSGSDAQRSFSIPADSRISRDGMQKPGFQFLWKVKLGTEPVQLNSLTPATLIDRYIGYRGFRSLAFVGSSSNNVYAVDTDLSRIEWQTHLSAAAPSSGSVTCPGGLTANIARPTIAAYPPREAAGGGLGGRSTPARSGVGTSGEGAVTIPAALAALALAGPGRAPQPRLPSTIYALAGDGMLHTLYISNGAEPEPPVKFVPNDVNAQGLTVIDGVAYVSTSNCNDAMSGVWALDLASKQVNEWHASSGTVAGSAGPSFGPDGTVYATTSEGELVALDPKTLMVRDRYTTGGQAFSSSPVVFPWKRSTLIAAATKDGRIHLLAGGDSYRTALFVTPPYAGSTGLAPSALASWESSDGGRWILAAFNRAPASGSGFSPGNGPVSNGAIAAWKLVDNNGQLSLEPSWLSRDLVSPLTPVVINGVVFAVASGEYRSAETSVTAAERARKSSSAVLYALDGTTGKALWDSGRTITSFVHSGGVSGGANQVYLETWDQYLYAFGYPIEH